MSQPVDAELDANVDRARRVVGAINERDRVALEGLVDEAVVGHALGAGSTSRGRDRWLDRLFEFVDAFPDLRIEIEDVATRDDRVMCRVEMSGTFTGPFDGQAPSGRSATVAGFHAFRFADGRVVEWWRLTNLLGWGLQLDALPTGPGPLLRIVCRQLRWRLVGSRKR